jgi:hypothetical protein
MGGHPRATHRDRRLRSGGAYPLAVVVVVREREAALACAELATAAAAEERARSGRERVAALVSAHAARLASRETALESTQGDRQAAVVQAEARHLGRLRDEAAGLAAAAMAAEAEVGAAAAEVAARADRLAVARGAVRALERHRERWRAALASARERGAEAETDALVSARRSGW